VVSKAGKIQDELKVSYGSLRKEVLKKRWKHVEKAKDST
jgi:hypothetical protein